MRRIFPLGIVLVTGLLGVVPFFVPHPTVQLADDLIRNKLLRVISMFAMILGIGSLIRHNVEKIRRKREHWPYSYILLGSLLVTAVIGVGGGIGGTGRLPTVVGGFHFDIQTLYTNIIIPLGGTMFALLAFFMSSAAYRAFRVHNLTAALLLVSAFVIMLGMVPLGESLGGYLSEIGQWILTVPNTASKRGIMIGVALGAIATSLKIILGVERKWLGGER
jgi:uncharacterized protein YjeT (DUF2065 family)